MNNHSPLPGSELDQLVTIFRGLKPHEKEDMSKRFPEIMNAVGDTVFALVYCDVASASNYPVAEQLRNLTATIATYSSVIPEITLD